MYSNAFMRYEEFCEWLQTTIIARIHDSVSKVVSLIILGYIYTLLESLFYSKSNGVIFNLYAHRPISYGRII